MNVTAWLEDLLRRTNESLSVAEREAWRARAAILDALCCEPGR